MVSTNNKEQLQRIRQMERHLARAASALKRLSSALDKYEEAKTDIAALASYYGSDDWKQDFADDEAGRLPKDLKRGVLSEDGIYNLLERYREIESEEKKHALFLHQKETLDTFLAHGTITRAQYEKSYGDLVKKMGIKL